MTEQLLHVDATVSFRNSQGFWIEGHVIQLSRQTVVFEMYHTHANVSVDEVLTELCIPPSHAAGYKGRAVVRHIVNTGFGLIVSATLDAPWSPPYAVDPGDNLGEKVTSFIHDWQRTSASLDPGYRLVVSRAGDLLKELRRWLIRAELAAGITDAESMPEKTRSFVAHVESAVMPVISGIFAEFERHAAGIDPERLQAHKAFARHELHPLMMCAPFIHRTFTKPLGYAGDYEMVNMMFRDRWEGANTYAKVVNSFVYLSGGAQAHRNRIDRLVEYLETEGRRVHAEGRKLRVLNIACGPAIEVQRFVRESPAADHTRLELLDFNAETLAHARARIDEAVLAGGRQPEVSYIHKSIHDLLQETRGKNDSNGKSHAYDLVYCAGLFDYLSDRLCARLLELFQRWTRPGGLMVATNVHPRNPVRFFIEHLLEWYLVYRDHAQMQALAPSGGTTTITEEATRVNLFLEFRKHPAEP